MSHFDDVEPLVLMELVDSPRSIFGVIISILLISGFCWWAYSADKEAEAICTQYGEQYVDSNSDYTLCEQDGGTVMRRESVP